jgi:hypothetical protein
MLNLQFSATVTGTTPLTGTTTLISRGAFALRAYPVDSIISTLMMTLNNQSFTIQSSEIIPYLARFWKTKDMQSFPSFLDTYANYIDGLGAGNNPLGVYFDNIYPDSMLRGSYPLLFTNMSATGGTVSGNIMTPVFLPVLHHDDNDSLGFSGIKNMDFTFNWSPNLARIFSQALGANLTSINVTLGQPTLYMRYTSPPLGYVPRTLTYGTHDINRFITPCPQTGMTSTGMPPPPAQQNFDPARVTQTFVSTNIQLNCIPAYLIAFCRESNANLTSGSADTAMNISNVSINFDNISGILSSASEQDLWRMSHANGLQCTYQQWHGTTPSLAPAGTLPTSSVQVPTVGSFLKLVFGKDIMLAPNRYVGQVGAFNLSMNVTINAINPTPVLNPMFYIITVSPQKIVIHEDGQIQSILGISGEDGQYIPYHKVAKEFFGAGFTDWIKKVGHFLEPINKFLKDSKLISSVASSLGPVPYIGPVASQVGTIAKQYGYGEGDGGMQAYGEGGRIASRSELMRRIKKLS